MPALQNPYQISLRVHLQCVNQWQVYIQITHVSPDAVWHVEWIVVAENSELIWSIVLPEAVNSLIMTVSFHKRRQLLLRLLVAIVSIIHSFQHYMHHVTSAQYRHSGRSMIHTLAESVLLPREILWVHAQTGQTDRHGTVIALSARCGQNKKLVSKCWFITVLCRRTLTWTTLTHTDR